MTSLTGLLRRKFSDHSASLDYSIPAVALDLRKERFAALKRKRLDPVTVEAQKQLTWDIFTEGATDELKRQIRPKFNEYVKTVQELSGEAGTKEIFQTAYVVYKAISNDKKAELENIVGSIDAKLFTKLKQQVTALIKWKDVQALLAGSENDGKSVLAPAPAANKEFGADLEFEDSGGSGSESEGVEEGAIELAPASSPVNFSEARQKSVKYDWHWLLDECEKLMTFSMETGEALMNETAMATNILSILQRNQPENQLQMPLIELIGTQGEAFSFIEQLLAHRSEFRNVKPESQSRPLIPPEGVGERGRAGLQLVGVSVKSSKDVQYAKQLKHEERRMQRKSEVVKGKDTRNVIDQDKLEEQANLLKDWKKDYSSGRAGGLPEGAVRTQHKGYEEVFIPAPKQKPIEPGSLIKISELEDYAQLAFKDTKQLNRLQSEVFHAAYRTNNNLLVCAPTGAGKTNVALLTALHEIGQHLHDGMLQKEAFKIVYVAPMKALAQEVQGKFQEKLAPLGVTVKELTGDMQLTKAEIANTQMLVVTPEKWDVITRKAEGGSDALLSSVRLLILDEVHLLHEDRGPVLEILVARTLRMVETSQKMCRIVGLSATLPNYHDVAVFLGVNPKAGLFFFDNAYRPVPLTQTYIGVADPNQVRRKATMNTIAYEKALKSLRGGHQLMVFVHSRKDTVNTAQFMRDLAQKNGTIQEFGSMAVGYDMALQKVQKSRNSDVRELFPFGFGVHHAGMDRYDRSLVEKLFKDGLLNVIVCTATLAWGVNLPAHTVIIKGTEIYDPERGGWVDVGMLDVMQIFGRAGRPQYDTSGEGIIITAHDKLQHYLTLLNHQMPIESQFPKELANHLNAEIILGTVTNLREAISWLSYTYLYTRMLRNPMAYGVPYEEKAMDPLLQDKRRSLVIEAAKTLMAARMVKFDMSSGNFFSTDLGRVASHYYIHHESVRKYNLSLKPNMTHEQILHMLASSQEFQNIRFRDEEIPDLEKLASKYCPFKVEGGMDSAVGKVNILLQTYISRGTIESSTLNSDSYYITQSAGRITRALFEMVLKRGRSFLANKLLSYCKMIDRRIWDFQHPLRQFTPIKPEIIMKLESAKGHATLDALIEMEPGEIGVLVRHKPSGPEVLNYCKEIPHLEVEAKIQPITRTVLQIELKLRANFKWNDRFHGSAEPFWVWIEDAENEHIYHHEPFLLQKAKKNDEHKLTFTIPIFEPLPPQYFVKICSDRWLGNDIAVAMSFKHLILPELHPPNTALLDLQPIPITALHNPAAQSMYKHSHLNPIQSQAFHTVYHTDENVLLGAPTGSGKTMVAEIAMLRLFMLHPNLKVVYIAPMKALARERMLDWNRAESLKGKLGKVIVELTGDTTPDGESLKKAHVLITTPEKWDGVSRQWQTRPYVKSVGLVIIDEIHLLGQDRGPVLEVIVSRMRYISTHTETTIRVVGLSTALANARDLADWLGIDGPGLFNFHPVVRPVPLAIYISGFPGKHYCPRMATMNKPCYAAITTHSPNKPVLVFVSSRRQTRLTALELIQFSASDGNPRKFLKMSEQELDYHIASLRDPNLKHMISFGIGMHHAGLSPKDRGTVENLFVEQKIQVLVCTSTLAWGVNFPAHLVVIKGTEYYDAKVSRYVDFPITDVLQMMGRAGRPQFDQEGKAVVLVHEPKKNFYMNFLHSPFPVESSLLATLHDHINAEVVGGTISSIQDAIDYLTWTFFFRRLLVNPSYYGLENSSPEGINEFLLTMVKNTLQDLATAGCVNFEKEDEIEALPLGKIASYYYLKYTTVQMFANKLQENMELPALVDTLSSASEFEELPVRHNEDKLNEELSTQIAWEVDVYSLDSPFTKANILFQAHFARLELPISDYYTDLRSVLDQAIRVLQAMVDLCAEAGWLDTTMKIMNLAQMVTQGRYLTDSSLIDLPHMTENVLRALWKANYQTLPELMSEDAETLFLVLKNAGMKEKHGQELLQQLNKYPSVDVKVHYDKSKIYYAGEECQCDVTLKRIGKFVPHVYAPGFPKPKQEGWWLVLGRKDPSSDELVALKRVFVKGSNTHDLAFDLPENPGEHSFVVYLISDSYIGLDQQYEFNITVVEGAREPVGTNEPTEMNTDQAEDESRPEDRAQSKPRETSSAIMHLEGQRWGDSDSDDQ